MRAFKRFAKDDEKLCILLEKALKCMVLCVQHLMKKLPFSCSSLVAFQGLDPQKRRYNGTLANLDSLVDIFAPIVGLSENEVNQVKSEVRYFVSLEDVPESTVSTGKDIHVPLNLW